MALNGEPSKKKKRRGGATFQYHTPRTATQTTHQHTQYISLPTRLGTSSSKITVSSDLPSKEPLCTTETPAVAHADTTSEDFMESSSFPVANGQAEEPDLLPIDEAYVARQIEMGDGEIMKRFRPKGDDVLRQWMAHRDLYVKEYIAHEGRGSWATKTCVHCKTGDGQYQCVDCGDREMYCHECVVSGHEKFYLHRIRRWTGVYFEKTTLKLLGLRVQLGHRYGERCFRPQPCSGDEFCILDLTGLHKVSVDFCGCGRGEEHMIQLLRARLFPSTVIQPQSAASFSLLDFFEILSFESKASMFEVYQTLVRITCNTGLNLPNDRYMQWVRMVHEWLHLHMLVRGGRGHEPGGVDATREGELVVLCPPCPHPGINMLPNWETAPPDQRYLHAKFCSMDANFRLKRKNVSSDRVDPGLNSGWAYFVEERKYKAYLGLYQGETEPKSSCSRHDAINLADAKPNRGHAASGVGKVMCTRHEMNLPNSIGDLQYGERYCNMDYLFYNALSTTGMVKSYVISYDIACQWSKNLQSRISKRDNNFFLFMGDTNIKYLVPKFHLPAHVVACRSQFSFNYTRGVGRTDGEGVERGWKEINPLAMSTREMGPGTRRDILDAHFGDNNWRKTVSLASMERKKLFTAALDKAEHVIDFTDLTSTVPKAVVDEWTKEVQDWEADPKKPNPFAETIDGPTQATVRRELAEAEEKAIREGRDFALDDNVSPVQLIDTGIQLEAEQRSLKADSKKVWAYSQDRQLSKLQFDSNTLLRKIDAWTKYQQLYCPGTERLRAKGVNQSTTVQPYDIVLWLPSQIKADLQVSNHLQKIEFEFREAQARAALNDLRRQLQVRAQFVDARERWTRGQSASTRANELINKIQQRIHKAADTYKAAFGALTSLSTLVNEHEWKDKFKELQVADIRALNEGILGESEGGRTISWIWRTGSVPKDALDGIDNGAYQLQQTKVEWMQARARANGFSDEVDLVCQEMMRSVLYFAFMANKWRTRGSEGQNRMADDADCEALQAYAEKTAVMYEALGRKCAEEWADLPEHVNRMDSIIDKPEIALEGEFNKSSASKARAKAHRKEERQKRGLESDPE